ncbi:LacI family DNA-binding transcriptional regulator [Periweissella cryptocerci]|nr:LacI family DNA-binding transcriptional regulator [Periweissella cryptocerci]
MEKDKVTITEIAELAGVSIATISRYINGHLDRMSQETSKKIAKIIAENDFVPNKAAQKLKRQATGLIGVMIANIDDNFSTELFKGADSILQASGYDAILLNSNANEDRERDQFVKLRSQQIEGLIIQPLSTDGAQYNDLQDDEMPAVLIDRELTQTNWPVVESNNFDISAELAGVVADKGYEKVIVVTEPVGMVSTRHQRVTGIEAGLANRGIKLEILEVSEKDFDSKKIYAALCERTADFTIKTAVIALKEQLLLRLLAMAYQHNVSYPAMIGLTGFADTEMVRVLAPELTTVQQGPFAMGAAAAEILVNRIQHKSEQVASYIVKAHIMQGNSI